MFQKVNNIEVASFMQLRYARQPMPGQDFVISLLARSLEEADYWWCLWSSPFCLVYCICKLLLLLPALPNAETICRASLPSPEYPIISTSVTAKLYAKVHLSVIDMLKP